MMQTSNLAPRTRLEKVLHKRGMSQADLARGLRTKGHRAPDSHVSRIVGGAPCGPAYKRDIAELVGETEETLWG
jgi:hypothetical protein